MKVMLIDSVYIFRSVNIANNVYDKTGLKYFIEVDDDPNDWDIENDHTLIEKDGNVYYLKINEKELRIDPVIHEVFKDVKDFRLVDIPDDIKWFINYDDYGQEWVCEEHRTWC